MYFAVSGLCNEKVLNRGPYGGCEVLVSKSLDATFKRIDCDGIRVVAVMMAVNYIKFQLINAQQKFR
jgi:hypothetical protein